MDKLKWVALFTAAFLAGLLVATVGVALSLATGSWIPVYIALALVVGAVGFVSVL